MKREDVNKHKGRKVVLNGKGDLAFEGELKPLIRNKVPLYIVKLTRGGMVYLTDVSGKFFYSAPPTNVDIVEEENEI